MRNSNVIGMLVAVAGVALAGCQSATQTGDVAMTLMRATEQGALNSPRNPGSSDLMARAPFSDAIERGDWDRVYREALPLAESGHRDAQHVLGLLYGSGRGVRQDEIESFRWYRKAAEQGESSAQLMLGLKYWSGSGAARDTLKAYALIEISGRDYHTTLPEHKRLLQYNTSLQQQLAKEMTRAQVFEAMQMVSDCSTKRYRRCGL